MFLVCMFVPGVVELMAGGTIVIAHNSGGPKLDIVREFEHRSTGYLADDVASYANTMQKVFSMSPEAILDMQRAARESSQQFSDQNFEETFVGCLRDFLDS